MKIYKEVNGVLVELTDAELSEFTGRTKNRDGFNIVLTNEEESARDVEEADYILKQEAALNDPINFPLSRWQFHAMVDIIGKKDAIQAAIDSIDDPSSKSVALAKFNHSSQFRRDDKLVLELSAEVGMTPNELDASWMLAKDL